MKSWRISLLTCALLAWSAHANTVSDFRRATTLSLSSSSAKIHTTGFMHDDVQVIQSDAAVCMTKATGTLDVDFDLTSLGLPLVVHFTGTTPSADRIRLVANQSVEQCLSINGEGAFIHSVSGTLTLVLSGKADPVVDSCGETHSQSFSVNGGGESDLDNRLVIDAESSCSGVSFSGTATISEIKLGGLSGAPEPDAPIEVASFTSEQTFICPPAGRDLTLPGELLLQNVAPHAGALFTLSTNDSRAPISPASVFIPSGRRVASFSTFIPKGVLGDFTFTAQGPQGAVATHTVTVTNDVLCRVIQHLPKPPPSCPWCRLGLRLRNQKPSGVLGIDVRGDSAFSTAPIRDGAAGYSTMDGVLTGWVRVGLSTVEFPNRQFFDLSEAGLAVGADRRGPSPTPIRFWSGNLDELESPVGVGEARFVDDAGNAGGWIADVTGQRHAALWVDRTLTLFSLPTAAVSSEVASMADDGTVVVVYRTSSGLTRSLLFNLADGGPSHFREVNVPRGYSGVELVGANASGIAGHLLGPNGAEPFIDFGAGVQLLGPMLEKGLEVDRLMGLGPANELIAHGKVDDVEQDMILRGER